jgi:hypothetical protein
MINGIDIYHGDELVQQDFITLARQNELYFIFIKATTGGSGKDNLHPIGIWQEKLVWYAALIIFFGL